MEKLRECASSDISCNQQYEKADNPIVCLFMTELARTKWWAEGVMSENWSKWHTVALFSERKDTVVLHVALSPWNYVHIQINCISSYVALANVIACQEAGVDGGHTVCRTLTMFASRVLPVVRFRQQNHFGWSLCGLNLPVEMQSLPIPLCLNIVCDLTTTSSRN